MKLKTWAGLGILLGLAGGSLAQDGGNIAGVAARTVEPRFVCMVNDKVMDRPQIAVAVGGKTYYGCCQGCVTKLNNDRRARRAKDPVSGRVVDKAAATILEGPDGAALYFESAETASRYRPQPAPAPAQGG